MRHKKRAFCVPCHYPKVNPDFVAKAIEELQQREKSSWSAQNRFGPTLELQLRATGGGGESMVDRRRRKASEGAAELFSRCRFQNIIFLLQSRIRTGRSSRLKTFINPACTPCVFDLTGFAQSHFVKRPSDVCDCEKEGCKWWMWWITLW